MKIANKLIPSILSTLVLTSLSTQGASLIVMNFGEANNIDSPTGITLNAVATTTANGNNANVSRSDLLTTAGTASGMSVQATGGQWFSMGGPGSFAPVGGVSYNGTSAIIGDWQSGYATDFGNIWQRGANSSQNGDDSVVTGTMVFSGLLPNYEYTFTLLSVRANNFLNDSHPGTFGMTYGGGTSGISATLSGAGTLDSDTKVVSGVMTGNSEGLNAREISWSFTTGETPEDAFIALTGSWNVNAIVIEAIPEPGVAGLALLGALALLRRRR